MELFEAIRRDARRDESVSIRGLADRYGVHRRTVRAALASAVPAPRKVAVRVAPKLGPWHAVIDDWLRADLAAPRKQRHTARRVWVRLIEEHQVQVSYPAVRDYVRAARERIAAEAGVAVVEVMVPQQHDPGAHAEVDFADLWIDLAGVRTKVFLFTLRMSFSGKAFHYAYVTQSQEAFFDGHIRAFTAAGGVPTVHVKYDNLTAAVKKICYGRTRVENEQWVGFRSHYGFEAFYCRPGKAGAHEKGGVEAEGGRFRRTHLVPVPAVASMGELNDRLARYDARDDHRRIAGRTTTVGTDFALEQSRLGPLPSEAFTAGTTLWPRVDRQARISVRQVYYSVPAALVGTKVRVLLGATDLVVFDHRGRQVATHPRHTTRGEQVLTLDHYLDVLARKPGALPGSMPLAQARAAGVFTATHEAWWAAMRNHHGNDRAATADLIAVLLLHRTLPAQAVLAGITATLAIGATNPDVVASQARLAAAGTGTGQLIALPARIPPDPRPLPALAAYDELLTKDQP